MDSNRTIEKSKELVEHTLRLTGNPKNYPKKYGFTLVARLQNLSLDIFEKLMDANRINLQTGRIKKMEMLTEVIGICDKMCFLIELSYKLNLISVERMDYWSKLVNDVKYMTISWRTKTKTQ